MISLKRRLFVILVATTGLIWLIASCWIYVGTRREVESVLDTRLQEAARMVSSLVPGQPASGQREVHSPPMTKMPGYERQLSCQIWSLDGHLMARSSGAPDTRLSEADAGFSERLIDGETWRVYTIEDASKGIRVLVGDRLGLREHLVAGLIKGLLAPMLLIVPLLGLLIWASLNRGLRPLQLLAKELSTRSADDMSAVEAGRIPSEIRPVVASLNALFAKVEAARAHEREFTAFVAHELRTPLAGLRTQVQISLAATDPAVKEAALRQVMIAVDRTTRLVRQLLAISRLDAISESPRNAAVDVGDVLDEVLADLAEAERRTPVTIAPGLRRTSLPVNRELLRLAIRNLHENAVRHMPQDGLIRWTTETSLDTVTIAIEDEGPGIPTDELHLVTQRFFRGRHKSLLGSGLGLTIVETALRANNAELRLSNRPDRSGLRAEMIWRGPGFRKPAAHGDSLRQSRKIDPLSAARIVPAR